MFSAVEHVQVGEVVETNQIHSSHCQHLQLRIPEQANGTYRLGKQSRKLYDLLVLKLQIKQSM